jgi:hypothetical protein
VYYKAYTNYFPVVLCTTKLAQTTSQYYTSINNTAINKNNSERSRQTGATPRDQNQDDQTEANRNNTPINRNNAEKQTQTETTPGDRNNKYNRKRERETLTEKQKQPKDRHR